MSEHSTGRDHARMNGTELTEPHRRYNPLSDEWLLVSSNRTSRPWLGLAESAPDSRRPRYDAACYLCPGNVRANGEQNPDYGSTFVFRNDYAALQPDSHIVRVDKGLLRAETARGTCMVLCFSPRHDVTLAGMDHEDVRRVVNLWASQSAELGSRFPWVQVFENRGAAMGASNPHPHGQIWAGEALPREAVREDATQRRHFESTGNRLLLDYVAQESGGSRDIGSNDEWLLVVPYWATWPHETLLVPRRQVSRLPELDGAQRDSLASSMGDLLRGYDRLFNVPFPYSMGWHQAPFDGEDRSHWQLHAHFYPPLLQATVRKFMVGYELLSEPQRDISPEDAAERLKSAINAANPGRPLASGRGNEEGTDERSR